MACNICMLLNCGTRLKVCTQECMQVIVVWWGRCIQPDRCRKIGENKMTSQLGNVCLPHYKCFPHHKGPVIYGAWCFCGKKEREKEIKFICLFGDRGHWGPYSPYKPCNHNLYIGIIIFPSVVRKTQTIHNKVRMVCMSVSIGVEPHEHLKSLFKRLSRLITKTLS